MGKRKHVQYWLYNLHRYIGNHTTRGILLILFFVTIGTVSAADEWDGDVKAMDVNKGMAGSYEELFHSIGKDEFMLLFRSNVTGIKIDKELGTCQKCQKCHF